MSNDNIIIDKIEPIGSGVFGDVYDQFKGKAEEAFNFLISNQGGDLLGVFHREELGDIDLVWGDESGGLKHIILKHIGDNKSFSNTEEAMMVINSVIESGEVVHETIDKAVLQKENKLVTIRRNYRENGKKIADKNWVLTAYDEKAADDRSAITVSN